ncbi:hypothetical protein F2Q69_00004713 [Brassica cretica]|uniref:Uncharacterized protein n=1 Tax=Brassica cretica TaxID=69181 RepID=A0A8S9NRM7_BRACR|nr:hypothetical protein F2Q69_00004713 [Brassica cretica]
MRRICFSEKCKKFFYEETILVEADNFFTKKIRFRCRGVRSSSESLLESQRGEAPSCGVKGVDFSGFWRLILSSLALKTSWFDDLLGLISVSHGGFIYLMSASRVVYGCACVVPPAFLSVSLHYWASGCSNLTALASSPGNWRRFFLSRGGLRLFGLRALFDTRGGCYSNPFSCIVLGGGDGCTAVSGFYS